MRAARVAFATAVAGIVATGAAGCTAGGTTAVDLPPKNLSSWTLPLDEFSVSTSGQRDYAEALLIEPCMTEAGYEFPVPWQPLDRGTSGSYTVSGQRLFTAELAALYGYHSAPVEWEGKDEWRAFGERVNAIADATAGYDEQLTACREEARTTVPVPSEDALYYAGTAGAQSFDEAILNEAVQTAVPKWAECMADAGYPGLAPSPDLMPGRELSERWQTEIPGTTATSEEIATAVADARCSHESGWTQALYDAQWDWQADFVAANQDRLLRIRAELTETLGRLEQVIRENAPAR